MISTDFKEPSAFALIIDKLREMSEPELKVLYNKLFINELEADWNNLTSELNFKNSTEADIDNAIMKIRYPEKYA